MSPASNLLFTIIFICLSIYPFKKNYEQKKKKEILNW